MAPMTRYALYIVQCADGTYYTGIATNLARRLAEHNGGSPVDLESGQISTPRGKGARYTASRRPVFLVFSTEFSTKSQALREEARIKRLSRREKCLLIASARPGG